jgi:hypothetical protein
LGRSLVLAVAEWAAIVSAETVGEFGLAEPATAIPANQRRRLPAFSRDVLRCALPLLRTQPRIPLILTSENGDLESTVTLLTDIARGEILSPSLFGLSVHNAPVGALSLSLDSPGDQIALAAGAGTLAAGLVEAYARLASGEAAAIVVIHAAGHLPAIYAELDEAAPGVFLAMTLSLVADASVELEIAVRPNRAGAVAVVHALAAGPRRLRFSSFPHIEAQAA